MALHSHTLKNIDIEKMRSKLVEHLLDKGWLPNNKYIEDMKKKRGEYNLEDVDMDALVTGKYKYDYHLITKCERFTVRIKFNEAIFWKIDSWDTLAEVPIDEIVLTEKGIRWEIISIEV